MTTTLYDLPNSKLDLRCLAPELGVSLTIFDRQGREKIVRCSVRELMERLALLHSNPDHHSFHEHVWKRVFVTIPAN